MKMTRNSMELVMQILPATIVVVIVLLSAVSATDGVSSDQLTSSQVVTLTKIETATVTLTLPPSTITETSTVAEKDFNLRTVTQTQHACTNNSPITTINTMDENSASLAACLRDFSSMLVVNSAMVVGCNPTEILPTAWVFTTATEAPATVASFFTETVSASTDIAAASMSDSDSTDEFVGSLTSMLARISDIYPYVEEPDKQVLDMLKALADTRKVELQLNKLPRNQKELVVDEMLQLTESIKGMVDESEKYKRVVPINFMGSVKRLIRYLTRLIRF